MSRPDHQNSRFFESLLAALLVLAMVMGLQGLARAQTAGSINYNSGVSRLQFYNGTSWVDFGDNTTLGPCTTAGVFDYDTLNSVFRYCDGSNWRRFTSQVTSMSCSPAGKLDYETATSTFRFCNGTVWVRASYVPDTIGYFVMTGGTYSPNLGGLSGGNSTCVTTLTSNTWKNKASAGPINSMRVRAFLCDNSQCNNLPALTNFQYARTPSSTAGGGTFTTDATGAGPGTSTAWSLSTAFGMSGNIWSGRGAGTSTYWSLSPGSGTCNNWGSNTSSYSGTGGTISGTDATRWNSGTDALCNTTRYLICYVVPAPMPFDFADVSTASPATMTYSAIQLIEGLKTTGTVSISGGISSRFRVCANSTCSSVISDWSTTGTILAGQYLQLRSISPATATSSTATVSIDGVTDAWAVITTVAATDNTPNAFSFPTTSNVTALTLYNSSIVQVTGVDGADISVSGAAGTPAYRVCADATCSTVLVDWTTSAAVINNNQYVQLRMTAGDWGAVTRTATLTVGTGSANWDLVTKPMPPGYFVAVNHVNFNGNLGGISGANALCLEQLSKSSFLGKSSAAINSTSVKAFLCDSTQCNNLTANSPYYFASTNAPTSGGAFFTSTAAGLGPNDSSGWSAATYFNFSGSSYWTGRGSGTATLWPATGDTSHCSDWTSTTGLGRVGTPGNTTALRWYSSTDSCNNWHELVCVVNPQASPDAFSFLDVTNATVNSLISSDIVQVVGMPIVSSVMVSSSDNFQYRICSDSTCATVVTDWTSAANPISNNQYMQVRMMSSGIGSTTRTGTVTIGTMSDSWSVTTASASLDTTPDAFSIPATSGAVLNTVTTSNIVQLTGFDSSEVSVSGAAGSPQIRICADASCVTVISDWNSGPASVSAGQYIQVRMTSAPYGLTARTATVNVGSATANWDLTSGPTGYFVLSLGTTKGNISGLSGANTFCLNDLTTNNWKGKASAGTLTAAKVRAFLCDSVNGCQMPKAGGFYAFARSGDVNSGGEILSVDANGYGPNDLNDWLGAGYFNIVGATYWTALGNLSQIVWSSTATSSFVCADWTSQAGGVSGTFGTSSAINSSRWNTGTSGCGTLRKLICMVDVDTTPDAFAFTAITGQTQSTLVTSNIVQVVGFDSQTAISLSGVHGSPQYRICSTNTCSTVLTDWTQGTSTIQPNQYVQIRLTTAPAAGTKFSAGVSIGGVSGWFSATTSGTIGIGYLVMTNATTTGNLGGYSGADATCLSQLTANNWTGKASAGTLNASRVRAFVGNRFLVQDAPYVTYAFARVGDTVGGGATFATDVMTEGPNDSFNWSSTSYFNLSATYWMAKFSNASGTNMSNTNSSNNDCSGFSAGNNSAMGDYGNSNSTTANRWLVPNSAYNCGSNHRFLCIVDPVLSLTPTIGSFTASTNLALNTLVTSNIVQVTGQELPVKVSLISSLGSPQFRICADSLCSTPVVNWTAGSATTPTWISNGQYLQMRVTTPTVGGVSSQLIVQVHQTQVAWSYTTTGAAQPVGYFVLSSATYNGNLGGLAGANALCLTDLTNNNWNGKASAGTLSADRVKAFLCEDMLGANCQTPAPNTQYFFARSGSLTSGGSSFSTTANTYVGYGPYDSSDWSLPGFFDGTYSYWTGRRYVSGASASNYWRENEDESTGVTTCNNWTDLTAAVTGRSAYASPGVTTTLRWNNSSSLACNNSLKLICMVTPKMPDAFTFGDFVNQTASATVTSGAALISNSSYSTLPVEIRAGPSSAQWRACDNLTCSGSTTAWSSSRATMSNGWYLQLRLTSSSAAGATQTIKVQVGGRGIGTMATWNVTTTGTLTPGYFVLSDLTYGPDMGGLSGADSLCLTSVQNNDWKGKSSAGTITASRVKAFLCDASTCRNPLANTYYYFAVSGAPTLGGAGFTTDASARGPDDSAIWAGGEYFGSVAKYWTGRSAASPTLWSSTANGNVAFGNWTSTSITGSCPYTGWGFSSGSSRYSLFETCGGIKNLVCIVDP